MGCEINLRVDDTDLVNIHTHTHQSKWYQATTRLISAAQLNRLKTLITLY